MNHKRNSVLPFLVPAMSNIFWIAALASAVGFGPRMMNIDGDLGRHITIGIHILDSGSVPRFDLFSHTMAGQSLTPHEWLAQAIFALVYRLMGLDGVVLITGVVIATTFCLVYLRSRDAAQGVLPAASAVLLAMAASSLHWLTRPHVFTFLLLVLWVGVLEDMRRGRISRWWWLPVMMLLWANLHGAFIAGFVSWVLYGAGLAWDAFWHRFQKGEGLHGHFWRYYLLGGGSALAATLVNPAGIELWKTSIGYVGSRYLVGHTAEYLPPNFHEPSTWPFLVFIGLLVVLLGLQSKRVETGKVLLAAAWMVMALYSVRNVPLFAIVAAPLLAGALGDWLFVNHHYLKSLTKFFHLDQRLLHTDRMLRGMLWPVLALAFVIAGYRSGAKLDLQQTGNQFDPAVFPVQAVDWLAANPQQGNVFNYFPWGGYLLFRTWPEQRVFIDGQTDFYGEDLTRRYEQVLTASPGWQDVLRQYNVTWAILPADDALTDTLRKESDWETVYRDKTAEILTKSTGN